MGGRGPAVASAFSAVLMPIRAFFVEPGNSEPLDPSVIVQDAFDKYGQCRLSSSNFMYATISVGRKESRCENGSTMTGRALRTAKYDRFWL